LNKTDRESMDFSGKVAVVTGGASGMGAANVRELSSRGANVVIVDLNQDLARDVANDVNAASPIVGDVSESHFCDSAIRMVVEKYSRIAAGRPVGQRSTWHYSATDRPANSRAIAAPGTGL
jgi:NAD(P)-dependent dehydrogenase (short-subunit alcohol dehydrogenase family)